MTVAADNLYTTQPNLSKAIKKLETDVGLTIFRRTPKGLVPTKRGAQFLGRAGTILDQLDELEAQYRPTGKTRIGFSVSAPRASYIAYSFTRFVHSLGGADELNLDFKETNSLATISSVAQREYKLGIIRYPAAQEEYIGRLLSEKELRCHMLWEFEPLLLFSAQHPLAHQESIRESDLETSILLEHGDLSGPYSPPEKSIQNAPRRIFVYERGSQFDLLQSVPGTYIWVSPVPEEILRRNGLVQRRCHRQAQHMRDAVIYPKSGELSDLDKSFIVRVTGTVHELALSDYH